MTCGRLAVSHLTLHRWRDLRKPAVELTRDARSMVEEVTRIAAFVDESALVEVTIQSLENRHTTSHLLDRDALRDRELKRSGELGNDLRRARLDQTMGVNAVLRGVRVARMGRDERSWVPVFVHVKEYAPGHHPAINADPSSGSPNQRRVLAVPG